MKTISVRDLRQRWPEAERALLVAGELIVTRDSKPVARLLRYVAEPDPRRRFDAAEHGRWQDEVHGRRSTRWVEKYLDADRNDR